MDNESGSHNLRAMQLIKHWVGELDDYVIDLAWSPDGTLLAAASAGGAIALFTSEHGTKQHELPGHDGGTNALAWAPDAPVTSGRSRASDRLPAATESSPASSLPSTALLATGGQDGAVKFWDARAGQHVGTAKLGTTWVEHLAWRAQPGSGSRPGATSDAPTPPAGTPHLFAAAGRTLAALRADGTVAHSFNPAPKTISALAAQPAGGSIAVAYFGGVVLWDADDFVLQKELPYGNGIHALVWSPDSKWLVSGNQDTSVHLWIPDQDMELHMSGYEAKVKVLSFDRSSRWLATGGGRDACIWDCAGAGPEGREPTMLPHEAPVCAVSFQNERGLLATAAKDGVVQLWSPERRQPLRATVKMPKAATKLAWSPDDRYLAIGSEQGLVYVLKCEA